MARRRTRRAEPFRLGTETVPAGRRRQFELPVARLATGSWTGLPVEVVHGLQPGPRVWISAAIHGDELNGIAITRRVLRKLQPRKLVGTVVVVPIVNVFGFLSHDRYLPDRRDLNRSFPGSARGSMAARLAHLFMESIVEGSTLGIDLHTGSDHRENLPQIRADLDDETTLAAARSFDPPVLLHAPVRDGSLRGAATAAGVPVLLYEGGQSNRYDDVPIRRGVDGVLRVLEHLGMLEGAPERPGAEPAPISTKSVWSRAGRSGLVELSVELGDRVRQGATVGTIYDSIGTKHRTVRSRADGMVVGLRRMPLVNRGDAVVHVARLDD